VSICCSQDLQVIADGYLKLLEEGHSVVRDVLLLIRNNPKDVFLIHCSMGKDRTGVIFAILLCLADVSHDDIASEYSLSEAALEPALPGIAAGIKRVISPPIDDEEALRRAKIVIQTRHVPVLFRLWSIADGPSGERRWFSR
jgi:hypothetical protein